MSNEFLFSANFNVGKTDLDNVGYELLDRFK